MKRNVQMNEMTKKSLEFSARDGSDITTMSERLS
jgi:hypothetical protein